MSDERTLKVEADGQGVRLDRHAATSWPDISRSRLAQLIEEGHLRVDGEQAKSSLRLKVGSTLTLSIPAPVAAIPQAEDLPLSTLYEDADVIVIDKAAGMVVHPAAGISSGTLVNVLLHHVHDLTGIGGELRPGIVHRLDKDTSGVMVVAKNEQALVRLQASFKARDVEKTYVALCHGVPPPTQTIETPFGRHPVDRVRMTGRLRPGDLNARRAVTHVTVVERFGREAARLEIGLETGRTHQIRVHLSEAGHPLLADETYGGGRRDKRAVPSVRAAAEALGRQALHAQRLAFPHPRTGLLVQCVAPLPPDFERALALLRAPVVASPGRR